MEDMEKCFVLIDESGDLGIGRGTQWFVLTAVILKESDERLAREKLKMVRQRLNIQKIHIRTIHDFNRRAYIASEISGLPFTTINVLIDTDKFDSNKIPTPDIAYNYACRYLLEKVSWYLNDINCCAEVILSARGTKRDCELVEYIKRQLLETKHNNFEGGRILDVSAKPAGQWDCLEIADVCATSLFLAYEKNRWGFRMPCYQKVLKNHLWSRNNKVINHGLKYFTDDMKPVTSSLGNAPCDTCKK